MATDVTDRRMSAADYIVFAVSLVLSMAIGFYYAYKDRKNKDMENFHRGNKQLNPFATSVSVAVTVVSALVIIGLASEVYHYGTMVSWEVVGIFLGYLIGIHLFLPVFYRMDNISVFEFIQKRFGKLLQQIASFLFIINAMITVSFTLYAPCLAFEAMTGISFWIAMSIAIVVCTTYTLLGGMKAVVWADTVQFIIMVAGLVCLLVEGSRAVGGFGNAWEVANRHGRIHFTDISFDPRTRHTVWCLVIGFMSNWGTVFATNQTTIQRMCSLPSLRTAKLVAWASFPSLILFSILSILAGVMMFAYYETCDPLAEGRISKGDQLFPLMIVDILGKLPGLPGLLLASLVSAALSTVSSFLNALSAVIIEDFIVPNVNPTLSDTTQLIISKLAVIVIAVVEFGLAGLFAEIGGLIHQLIMSLQGIIGGPLFGLFLSGLIFPWTNKVGIYAGFIVSFALTGWLIFGTLTVMPPTPPLPVSVEGCADLVVDLQTSSNRTLSTISVTSPMMPSTTESRVSAAIDYTGVEQFYRLSYMWYHVFGLVCFILISSIVSLVTGRRDPQTIDSKLMVPVFYHICPFLPERYRCKLSFGVKYEAYDGKGKAVKIKQEPSDNDAIPQVTNEEADCQLTTCM